MKSIVNVKQLKEYAKGKRLAFELFYGHKVYQDFITSSCFSQWYPSTFSEDNNDFVNCEQYMMAAKAKLFGDKDSLEKIMASKDPAKAKLLGRTVKDFDQQKWDDNKFDIVVQGNKLKFSQNEELKKYLISTGDKIIVEASPSDTIWGIGMSAGDPYVKHPQFWAGENLLGFALMEVRRALK